VRPFDENGLFQIPPNQGKLARMAVRGAGVTAISTLAGVAVQAVTTIVLARLLTPADFGLITMVTTFSLLFMNFGVNGLTEVIVQRAEMNRSIASNLFWISLLAGAVLTVAFAGCGSLLADFYRSPPLSRITMAMAPTIFLASISMAHLALLKRGMQFVQLSSNEVASRVCSVVVSILCALRGAQYWALVAGAIAQPLCQSVGAWLVCRWIPSLPRRLPGTWSMLRFALSVYGRFGVNYISRNVDNVLVGWRFDSLVLGSYKKAYDLFSLSGSTFVASIFTVAVPTLSRCSTDLVRYRRYVLTALAVAAFVGMGLGADLTLVGADAIRLLLGPGWEATGRIFTFFGPGIGIMLLYCTHGWIHLSMGTPERWFHWGLIEFACTLLLFLVALPWGPEGVAAAWSASFWALTIPAFAYALKPTKIKISTVIGVVWRYVLASLLAGCATAAIRQEMHVPFLTGPSTVPVLLRISTISCVFWLLYLLLIVGLHRGLQPLHMMAAVGRELLPCASDTLKTDQYRTFATTVETTDR